MYSNERSVNNAMETMTGHEIEIVCIRIIETDQSIDSSTAFTH